MATFSYDKSVILTKLRTRLATAKQKEKEELKATLANERAELQQRIKEAEKRLKLTDEQLAKSVYVRVRAESPFVEHQIKRLELAKESVIKLDPKSSEELLRFVDL